MFVFSTFPVAQESDQHEGALSALSSLCVYAVVSVWKALLSCSTRPGVGFGGFHVCFRRPKEIGLISVSSSLGGTTLQICLGCQNQGQLLLSLPQRPLPWLRLGREWAHLGLVNFSSFFSVFLASFFMLG